MNEDRLDAMIRAADRSASADLDHIADEWSQPGRALEIRVEHRRRRNRRVQLAAAAMLVLLPAGWLLLRLDLATGVEGPNESFVQNSPDRVVRKPHHPTAERPSPDDGFAADAQVEKLIEDRLWILARVQVLRAEHRRNRGAMMPAAEPERMLEEQLAQTGRILYTHAVRLEQEGFDRETATNLLSRASRISPYSRWGVWAKARLRDKPPL